MLTVYVKNLHKIAKSFGTEFVSAVMSSIYSKVDIMIYVKYEKIFQLMTSFLLNLEKFIEPFDKVPRYQRSF